jgi:FAD synthetase
VRERKVVLASGTFDLFHFGHIKYLEEARKLGGENAKLIVIVARDSTVEKRKGKRPVMSEDQRRAVVESLKVVDDAILGYEDFNIEKVIERIRPDVIAVGHDQEGVEGEVRRVVAEKQWDVQVVKVGRFGEDELDSSSKIKRKIIESFNRRSN